MEQARRAEREMAVKVRAPSGDAATSFYLARACHWQSTAEAREIVDNTVNQSRSSQCKNAIRRNTRLLNGQIRPCSKPTIKQQRGWPSLLMERIVYTSRFVHVILAQGPC